MRIRETNKRFVLIFILCSASIVAVTWTVGEKFIANASLALVVNMVVAIVIGLLFERYLEAKINTSIDFLSDKIGRVSRGDLTQRFKEDSDDIMPYGLSFQLGEMMRFLRENVGDLWKTSTLLSKQLSHFVESILEALSEFRSEVDYLSTVERNLDEVRKETMEVVRYLSDLKVQATSDVKVIESVGTFSQQVPAVLDKTASLLRVMIEEVRALCTAVGDIRTMMTGMADFSTRIGGVVKSLEDMKTEASLVNLNISIDATREQIVPENPAKLLAEARELATRIVAIGQESADAFETGDERIRSLQGKLTSCEQNLQQELDRVGEFVGVLQTARANGQRTVTEYASVSEHVRTLHEVVNATDEKTARFAEVVKKSIGRFDKVCSDTNITLLKFNELETKVKAIEANLEKLEHFKKLFMIA